MRPTQGQKPRQDATLVADITHDLVVARWQLLQQGGEHGIARECEAVVEPRRDREPYLALGVHIKHARLHREHVFQRRVVAHQPNGCSQAARQPRVANRLFRSTGAIVTGP